MAKEGQFISYTGEEAAALRAWSLERDEWHEHWGALEALVEDDPAARKHWEELEVRMNAGWNEWSHVLHARLVRVLPHLADVISFLVWPEFMETPDWLDERGLPSPAVHPHRTTNGDW